MQLFSLETKTQILSLQLPYFLYLPPEDFVTHFSNNHLVYTFDILQQINTLSSRQCKLTGIKWTYFRYPNLYRVFGFYAKAEP